MPGLQSTKYGSGNRRWLANSHGLRDARSGYGLLASFDEATHYPDGYLRSGTAVNAAVENDLKPWTGAAGEKLGFLVSDINVPVGEDEGFTSAVLRHGTINVRHLPEPLPTEVGDPAEPVSGDQGHFILVGDADGEDF